MTIACAPVELFAEPREIVGLEDCWFYHTIDLPGHGTVEGVWDLRGGVKEYCGGVDFRGKRVLEIGTASGFVGFAMEKQGAEVISTEFPPDQVHDFVPRAGAERMEQYLAAVRTSMEKMRNSYWLSHRALRSRARVVHTSVYSVPSEIGLVDIATFGCILLHLRDPFLALANALRLTRETVVVTMMMHGQPWERSLDAERGLMARLSRKTKWFVKRLVGRDADAHLPNHEMLPCMVFLPQYQPGSMDTWWFLTPNIVRQFLEILGFEESTVTRHRQVFNGRPINMYTVVAQRTQPMPDNIDGPYPWY